MNWCIFLAGKEKQRPSTLWIGTRGRLNYFNVAANKTISSLNQPVVFVIDDQNYEFMVSRNGREMNSDTERLGGGEGGGCLLLVIKNTRLHMLRSLTELRAGNFFLTTAELISKSHSVVFILPCCRRSALLGGGGEGVVGFFGWDGMEGVAFGLFDIFKWERLILWSVLSRRGENHTLLKKKKSNKMDAKDEGSLLDPLQRAI